MRYLRFLFAASFGVAATRLFSALGYATPGWIPCLALLAGVLVLAQISVSRQKSLIVADCREPLQALPDSTTSAGLDRLAGPSRASLVAARRGGGPPRLEGAVVHEVAVRGGRLQRRWQICWCVFFDQGMVLWRSPNQRSGGVLVRYEQLAPEGSRRPSLLERLYLNWFSQVDTYQTLDGTVELAFACPASRELLGRQVALSSR